MKVTKQIAIWCVVLSLCLMMLSLAGCRAHKATVTFVMNRQGAGEDVAVQCRVGQAIAAEDIPQLRSAGSYVFNCWTSDERGLVPCDPAAYTVEGDMIFYASWENREYAYAEDVTAIEKRDGKLTKKALSPAALYRVQVGAFSKKANADKLADELKKKGYSVYVVRT